MFVFGYIIASSEMHYKSSWGSMMIYDVSLPVSASLPMWPGDPPVSITWGLQISKGDKVNLSSLLMSSHSGTHVDAPVHLIDEGLTADEIPLEQLVGKATVVEIRHQKLITRQELEGCSLGNAQRVLFKTRNSQYWQVKTQGFQKDFVNIDAEAAEYIVELGVKLVGIDYLSVDAFSAEELKTHLILLRNDVVIVEGLDLSRVPAGQYMLYCLPLKIMYGDGAPARVILVKED
jgi:arylformamidase